MSGSSTDLPSDRMSPVIGERDPGDRQQPVRPAVGRREALDLPLARLGSRRSSSRGSRRTPRARRSPARSAGRRPWRAARAPRATSGRPAGRARWSRGRVTVVTCGMPERTSFQTGCVVAGLRGLLRLLLLREIGFLRIDRRRLRGRQSGRETSKPTSSAEPRAGPMGSTCRLLGEHQRMRLYSF